MAVLGLIGAVSTILGVIGWKYEFTLPYFSNSQFIWFGVIVLAVAWIIETSAKENKEAYCAKCDQFMGTVGSCKGTCPRCGSNRFRAV